MSRDTRTGAVLEQMVLHALNLGGYSYESQKVIGVRLGGGQHKVDVLARKPHEQGSILISLKWQQSSGTAEQKVPFEAMCLAEARRKQPYVYSGAYLVLGGEGWRLRDFFVGGGLKDHLRYGHLVNIVTLETFVAKANKGEL